ncbi:MAG: hypothetical protein P1T08_10410 [Acidimicrobiia bacterium]|nr:hypothetical protein [Acidimicrobiia bacterium]
MTMAVGRKVVQSMDDVHPSDHEPTVAPSPNSVRAERFGGPVLTGNAEFSASGFLVKKCELRSSAGKVATVRGNDVRFRDGSKLSFETFSTGVRPRHGRTVLVDLGGNMRAEAEWTALDHCFAVRAGDCTYTIDRDERAGGWRIHADGVVATFDHHKIEVEDPVPVVAVLLAWRVARTLEHLPAIGKQTARAWDRTEILGS